MLKQFVLKCKTYRIKKWAELVRNYTGLHVTKVRKKRGRRNGDRERLRDEGEV
jgi:hypothetical protein